MKEREEIKEESALAIVAAIAGLISIITLLGCQ